MDKGKGQRLDKELLLEYKETVMVCLHTYISIHRTTVVSITIVPSVACQTIEGEYIPTNHFIPTDTL